MASKEIYDVVLYTVPLLVHGFYEPEEQQVMYYKDGSGYPGCPAGFEITEVFAGDVKVTGILNDETLEKLEELILKENY